MPDGMMMADRIEDRIVAETPEQIAARYGAALRPGVAVQVVPRGQSSFVYPVWDGSHLVMPEGKPSGTWRGQRFSIGRGASDSSAAMAARRARVADLVAQGWGDQQMAGEFKCSVGTIIADRKALGLAANPVRQQAARQRRELLRELVAQGHDRLTISERLGVRLVCLPQLARDAGVVLPPPVRGIVIRAARASDETPDERRQRERERSATARGVAVRTGPSAFEITAARREQVARLHAEGLTVADSAARIGCTANVVRRDRALLGLPPTPADLARREESRRENSVYITSRIRRPQEVHDRMLADLRAGLAAGKSVRLIADECGYSYGGLRDVAHAAGIRRAALPAKPPLTRRRSADRVDARRARVAELRAEGYSLPDICEAVGAALSTISNDVRALGLSGTAPHHRQRGRDPVLLANVMRLHGQGLGHIRIGQALGLHVSTVRRLVAKGKAAEGGAG